MVLSVRLQHIMQMVDRSFSMADIGSDHGLIPLALLKNQVVKRAIAVEVAEGPYNTVFKAFQDSPYRDVLEARFGDGLNPIAKGEVQTVVIAGMGGSAIWRILTTSHASSLLKADHPDLILQPMEDVGYVRYFAERSGYRSCKEEWVKDREVIYPIIKYCAPVGSLQRVEASELNEYHTLPIEKRILLDFGDVESVKKNPLFLEYVEAVQAKLQWILVQLQQSNTESAVDRRQQIQAYLSILRQQL